MKYLFTFFISFSAILTNAQNIFFSDPAFKEAVISNGYDFDMDNEISYEEAKNISFLDISYSAVYTLNDLSYFNNLYNLRAHGLNISNAYIPYGNIGDIDFSGSNISNFKLENDQSIFNLNLSNTDLVHLDISSFTNIQEVNLSGSKIEYLKIGSISNLNNLNISSTPIQEICTTIDTASITSFNDSNTGSYKLTDNCCAFFIKSVVTHQTCPYLPEGKVEFTTLEGNLASFIFSVDSVNFSADNTFSNLLPGDYKFYVQEVNSSCTVSKIARIDSSSYTHLPEPELGIDTTICSTDSIGLLAPAGYKNYYWNGIPGSSSYTAKTGQHIIETVDYNNCKNSDTLTILGRECVSVDPQMCITREWLFTAGTSGQNEWESMTALIPAPDGYFYASGNFEGDSIVFGSHVLKATHDPKKNSFITKFDANKNFSWATAFVDSGQSSIREITTDDLGNVYFVGSFLGEHLTINGNPVSADTTYMAYVGKLNSSGNLEWVKSFGDKNVIFTDICITKGTEKLLIAGEATKGPHTIGSETIDPGTGAAVFVLELNQDGAFTSVHDFPATLAGHAGKISTDESGNIYLTGNFSGEIQLSTVTTLTNMGGTSSVKYYDHFIAKFTPQYETEWHTQYGGRTHNIRSVPGLLVDEHAMYIFTSYSADTVTFLDSLFTNNSTTTNGINGLMAKLDLNGNKQWIQEYAGISSEGMYNCSISEEGRLWVAGHTASDTAYLGDKYFFMDDPSRFLMMTIAELDTANGNPLTLFSYYGKTVYLAANQGRLLVGGASYRGEIFEFHEASTNLYLASLKINEQQNQVQSINFCSGDTLYLNAGSNYNTYTWNTGSEEQVIEVTEAGQYEVTVTDRFFCSRKSNTFNAVYQLPISVDLGEDILLGHSESVVLDPGSYHTYLWSTGETTETIMVEAETLEPGTYPFSVKVSFDGFCPGYDTVLVTVQLITESDDQAFQNTLVYPNPAKDFVMVSGLTGPRTVIQVVSLIGQVLAEEIVSGDSGKLDMQNIPSGTYILKINSTGVNRYRKIIVE